MRDDKTFSPNITGKVRNPSKDDVVIVTSLTVIIAICALIAMILA